MKHALFLLSAALSTAFVTPKAVGSQAVFSVDHVKHAVQDTTRNWWDAILGREDFQALADGLEKAVHEARAAVIRHEDVDDGDDSDGDHDHDHDHGKHGKHGRHGHHGDPSKTIYELISSNKHTKRFAALVDEHKDIKALLQDTKTNRTLFVPTDRAFERIPDHDKDKKPPAEFIRAILAYSIAPGRWPARRLYFSHTIPSNLSLSSLGDQPQRIRVSASVITGIHLNFFAKIVARDIAAKNGIIHAVDFFLLPPPDAGKILQLLPNLFSTYSLGLTTTELGEELASERWEGCTVFAPTNRAFSRLGPRANAFLFSDRGKKFLKALLKYSIVANETLYSDAYYRHKSGADGGDEESDLSMMDYFHADLPSLLNDQPIGVDIRTWKGWVTILVNGYTPVAAQDVLALDGVLQVVDRVLIPPRRRRGRGGFDFGREDDVEEEEREWEVEELVERLEPYLDEEREEEWNRDL